MRAVTVSFFFTIYMMSAMLKIQALPMNEHSLPNKDDCILMTEAKDKEIRDIIQELTDFIDTLAEKHEDIDLKLVKLDFDKYQEEDENVEQSTILEVFVNDCANRPGDKESFEYSKSESNDDNVSRNDRNANNDGIDDSATSTDDNLTSGKNDDNIKNSNDKSDEFSDDDDAVAVNKYSSKVKPELVFLDLDEPGLQAFDAVRRKGDKRRVAYIQPWMVYMQKNIGQDLIVFPRNVE